MNLKRLGAYLWVSLVLLAVVVSFTLYFAVHPPR